MESRKPSAETGGSRLANPETPGRASGSSEVPKTKEPPAPQPPPVTARPTPEPAVPRSEITPEAPREAPTFPSESRRGLTLSGPSHPVPSLPALKGQPPAVGPMRPSLRDQIASLGSGLTADPGGTAKQTINLDSREPQFSPYLARLKRRIEREWVYPEEAQRHGVGGELLLVFTLNKTGTLTSIQLVQTSGYPVLDAEALRAVKAAAPFDPFPPQLGEEPWNIAASFHYNLPYRFRRN